MRKTVILLALVLGAAVTLTAAPFIGMKVISPSALLRPLSDNMDVFIFWNIRIPRALTAFFAGAALSVSGMAFQALFRNPLATPFTLGVSSGAAFGAAFYVITGISITILGISGISISSFLGAILSIFIVYGVARVKRGFSTASMLLTGVAISFFFSSIILFIQYISDFTQSFRIIRWLMGGLETAGFDSFFNMLPFVAIGILVVLLHLHELNLFATGEDIALSRGVDVRTVKRRLFIGISLMVGGVVSVCGPIGFIGMMSPHICRLLIGSNHRYLAPATLLFGGTFLVLCDAVSRTLIAPAEIPVGVITAMLGGPFFIWLLVSGVSERSIIKG